MNWNLDFILSFFYLNRLLGLEAAAAAVMHQVEAKGKDARRSFLFFFQSGDVTAVKVTQSLVLSNCKEP